MALQPSIQKCLQVKSSVPGLGPYYTNPICPVCLGDGRARGGAAGVLVAFREAAAWLPAPRQQPEPRCLSVTQPLELCLPNNTFCPLPKTLGQEKGRGGGRKERKDKILHFVVLSSQVVPVGFRFICTGWGVKKKKTRWNSDKAQEMFEPDNKLPFVQGSRGKRTEKKGAEDQLKPTSALCSWAAFFFLRVFV